MSSLTEEVIAALSPLIGLKLSRTALAANMRTIQFGATVAGSRGGVVGEYALHIQCPWRLENDSGIITGNDDLYVPYDRNAETENFDYEDGGSRQEIILRQRFKGYDEQTGQIVNSTEFLVVETVEADCSGGFRLGLSGGYRLIVFPDGTVREAWRFFRPGTDGPHFVVPPEN